MSQPILAMLVGPAFGWANRVRRSRFGLDKVLLQQNELILAMLVGPAFGWANRAGRSRFGFDEATARWAGPCPARAGRAICFCSFRFASTRIQVHLFPTLLACRVRSSPFLYACPVPCYPCSFPPCPFASPFPPYTIMSEQCCSVFLSPQTSLPAPLAVSSTASCPRGCFETENLHAQQRSPAFSQIQNSTEVLLPGPLSA